MICSVRYRLSLFDFVIGGIAMSDLIRWKPFHSLLDDFFRTARPAIDQRWLMSQESEFLPNLDIKQSDKEIVITADIPGMDKKDVTVSVSDNLLTIQGERKGETRSEENGYVCVERSFGSFERRLQLPDDAESEKITAEYKNGVLGLHIPRREPQKSEVKQISIS